MTSPISCSRRTSRSRRRRRRDVELYVDYLRYYTVTDLAKARKIVEQTLPHVLESKVDWLRLQYLTAVRIFMEEWHSRRRRSALRIPKHVTPEWVAAEADRLAEAFDRRNGTAHAKGLAGSWREQARRLAKAYRA